MKAKTPFWNRMLLFLAALCGILGLVQNVLTVIPGAEGTGTALLVISIILAAVMDLERLTGQDINHDGVIGRPPTDVSIVLLLLAVLTAAIGCGGDQSPVELGTFELHGDLHMSGDVVIDLQTREVEGDFLIMGDGEILLTAEALGADAAVLIRTVMEGGEGFGGYAEFCFDVASGYIADCKQIWVNPLGGPPEDPAMETLEEEEETPLESTLDP